MTSQVSVGRGRSVDSVAAQLAPRVRQTLPGTRTVQYDEATGGLSVTVSSQVNLEIELAQPFEYDVPKVGRRPVRSVRCFVDDPAAMLTAVRASVAALD